MTTKTTTNSLKTAFKSIYDKTITNCLIHEENSDFRKLLNEIGALRSVCKCLELLGEDWFYSDKDYIHFIAEETEMLKGKMPKRPISFCAYCFEPIYLDKDIYRHEENIVCGNCIKHRNGELPV